MSPIRVGAPPPRQGLFEPVSRPSAIQTVGELEALLQSLVTRAERGERVGPAAGGAGGDWRAGGRGETELVHVERLPEREASFGDLAVPLPEALRQVLSAQEIERLYSHQARAVDLAREGRHVVIATGTASGKSLAYHLPILERLLLEPGAVALYLFPTKALAQD
ncbi:MAG TPA: DEAD/DEAH box helicase, partial [Candidatus Eisenbacteria bacterium]|nr:DEAD/DEAH box helicase [Candidatus Eisenbacteria bacterium]